MESTHNSRKIELQNLEISPEFSNLNEAEQLSFYEELFFVYIVTHDLINGKFLWKRVSKSIKESLIVKNLWSLGRLLWFKDYPAFHDSAKQLINSSETSEKLKEYIKQIISSYQNHVIGLCGRSYSSISIHDLSSKTGLDVSNLKQLLSSQNWNFDLNDAFVNPSETSSRPSMNVENTQLMEKITELMNYIETH